MAFGRTTNPDTLAKIERARKAKHAAIDAVVLAGLASVGGSFQGRIMQLRRYLPEPLREAQIKDAIRRLVLAERVRTTGEYKSGKGILYEVIL